MYSNHYQSSTAATGYPSEVSNNPFGSPDDVASADSRWPDLSKEIASSQPRQQRWTGYNAQFQNPAWQSDIFPGGGNPAIFGNKVPPQLASSYPSSTFGGSVSPPPLNPSSYPSAQPSYSNYSYQSPQVQSQYTGGYGGAGGYTQSSLAQFDPYANSQSQWNQGATPVPSSTPSYGPPSQSSYSTPHPRDYIRGNKSSLDKWDNYSWKQAQQSFNALKTAWENRLRELQGQMRQLQSQGYGYVDPQLEPMIKTAQHNIDVIASTSYQMKEAFDGYNISADAPSKKRVREALNAGLTTLPDWP